MAFEHYVYTGTQRLRCGYTTGSCAALAAQAAARMACGEPAPTRAAIATPAGIHVEADILDVSGGQGCARCAVRKDAGDDCDATDGMLIYAEVTLEKASLPQDENSIRIEAGQGIGRVTKPGLEQPVGEAAINSVPRAMIRTEVARVLAEHKEARSACVTVSAPEGERVAAKTFNPHLGIEGGISILGTTGIVEPRSLSALRDSIGLEISQAAALGARDIVLVPGNYGRDFLDEELPQLASVPVVSCSNFIGDALDLCACHGFERVLLVGHIGKLVKVAAGIMSTHSRTADGRCETICAHAALAGASRETAKALMAAATTDACLDILEADGLLAPVCASLAQATADRMDRRVAGAYEVGTVVFSKERGELYRTSGTDELIKAMTSGTDAYDGDAWGAGAASRPGDNRPSGAEAVGDRSLGGDSK